MPTAVKSEWHHVSATGNLNPYLRRHPTHNVSVVQPGQGGWLHPQ